MSVSPKKNCVSCITQRQSYGKNTKTYKKPLRAEEKENINEQRADKACKDLLINSQKISRALNIPPCVQQVIS